MKRWTLLLLVALVGVLVWLRERRAEEDGNRGAVVIQKPLLPGLQTSAVQRLRIEHLERGVDLLLERDAYGRWYLSDPLAYPAEGALVNSLLKYLHDATGPVVRNADLEALSLAPPRVVLTLTQAQEGGAEQTWRVEFGAIDLDARRVYARVPGHPDAAGEEALVTRVVRSLDTTLDRNPDDYRQTSCTTIPFTQVAELARGGSEDPALAFEVFLDADSWRRRDEPRVSMDPTGVGFLVRALTSLRARRFVDDAPTDVSPYGLDEPRLELELRAADGRRELLLFSTHPGQRELPLLEARWYALRDGFPHVWEVRAEDLQLLLIPTASLYDYSIVRAPEEDVLAVELRKGPDQGLSLERDDSGWWLQELGADARPRRRADAEKIGSLVARLVQTELGEYAPAGTFSAGDAPRTLVVRTRSGAGVEATLGARWQDVESGGEGPLFLRAGEGLAAIAPPDLIAQFELTLRDLEERLVHAVDEFEVDLIRIQRGTVEHVYRRQDRKWSVDPRGQVDGERAVLLERLLRFEAAEWLDDLSEALEDPLYVGFAGRVSLSFSLGRLADGRLVLDSGGRRALLDEDPLQQDLHAALLASFQPNGDD